MADNLGGSSSTKWVVIAILVVLFAVAAYYFLRPVAEDEPAAAQAPVADPAEWTEDTDGVGADLPDTPMTNVPPESEAGGAAGAGQ